MPGGIPSQVRLQLLAAGDLRFTPDDFEPPTGSFLLRRTTNLSADDPSAVDTAISVNRGSSGEDRRRRNCRAPQLGESTTKDVRYVRLGDCRAPQIDLKRRRRA